MLNLKIKGNILVDAKCAINKGMQLADGVFCAFKYGNIGVSDGTQNRQMNIAHQGFFKVDVNIDIACLVF